MNISLVKYIFDNIIFDFNFKKILKVSILNTYFFQIFKMSQSSNNDLSFAHKSDYDLCNDETFGDSAIGLVF